MSKYEPHREQLPDGTWVETYRDQERQSDAKSALDELTDPKVATVLWIMDGDKAVARVYRTHRDDELRYVIRIVPDRPITPSLEKLNGELGRTGEYQIRHAGTALMDPLEASNDRDLEVPTANGVVQLDREKVLDFAKSSQRKVALESVRHDDA